MVETLIEIILGIYNYSRKCVKYGLANTKQAFPKDIVSCGRYPDSVMSYIVQKRRKTFSYRTM